MLNNVYTSEHDCHPAPLQAATCRTIHMSMHMLAFIKTQCEREYKHALQVATRPSGIAYAPDIWDAYGDSWHRAFSADARLVALYALHEHVQSETAPVTLGYVRALVDARHKTDFVELRASMQSPLKAAKEAYQEYMLRRVCGT